MAAKSNIKPDMEPTTYSWKAANGETVTLSVKPGQSHYAAWSAAMRQGA